MTGRLEESTSHIYFKKPLIGVHNSEALQKPAGLEFVFEAENTNETTHELVRECCPVFKARLSSNDGFQFK